jgi:hypothetical protein
MTITHINLAFKKRYDDGNNEYETINVPISKEQRNHEILDFVFHNIHEQNTNLPDIFKKSLVSDTEQQFRWRLEIQFRIPSIYPNLRSHDFRDTFSITVLNVIRSPYCRNENNTIFISLRKKYSNATHPFLRPTPRIKKQK